MNDQKVGKMTALSFLGYSDRNRSLEEIKQRHESLVQNNPDGIIETNLAGQIIGSNPAFERILGFSTDELCGRELVDLAPLGNRTWANHVRSSIIEGRAIAGEGALKHRNGRTIYVQHNFIPIDVDARVIGVYVILKDITEDKLAEEELLRTKEQLQAIFDTLDVSLWSQDLSSRSMIQVSPGSELIWGIPLDKLLTDNSAPHSFVHPDDMDVVQEKMKVIEKGEPFVHDYRIIRPSGDVRWIHDRVVPVSDASGKPVRLTGISVDITESKLVEEERDRTRQALQRSDKLSALGQLAAGMAHEIRNPLTSLMGFMQLLQSIFPERRNYLDIMASEFNRINEIISEFLVLAKPQHVRVKVHDLQHIIEEVVSLLRSQAIIHNIEILVNSDLEILAICCNEGQIKQLFINLIKNSIEAMPFGGTIVIAITMHDESEALVRVSDEGCGIPAELISKIGEPFLTSKEDGNGLGLMVAQQLVHNHGGKILIESKVNKGTIVSVTLPIRMG
jgi:PAS domain S-box-containing protein